MRVLFTTWEGGGHVPPALAVASRLKARGAEVLFVSDEATRAAAERSGLAFAPWPSAPNRAAVGQADDKLDDWKARTPWGVVRSVCDSVMCAPADRYAADTLQLIDRFRPDAVVTNELLFGVMAACEARGLKSVILTGNLWCFPTRPDLPPFGPAFPPARTRFEHRREDMARRLIAGLYDQGRADLNRARQGLGLAPVRSTLDQLAGVDLTILGVARAFDYGDETPAGVIYAGPLATAPWWAQEAPGPPPLDGALRPQVLVSFSTTYQREEGILRRCIEALGRLPVQGLVTLGPALAGARLPSRANVRVVQSASHDDIMPGCAAVICHGGHGTVIRPLMHGVPVICIPTGRDQPENARRISERGAGLTLPRHASSGRIASALGIVLSGQAYRERAAELGRAIAAEADGGERAAVAIEAYASFGVVSAGGSPGPGSLQARG